jgi:SAM-dependent methyltransferase
MTYGEYILSTGKGRVGQFELVLGRFFYERDFVGRAPILDLAPGRCWFTRQNVGDIEAVDLAPEIVEHYSAQGVQITEGSAYEIPHPPDTFEAVFCCWLFEHLDDPDRAMCEILRVLKPGGMCYLVVPSDHQLTRGFWHDYTHVRPFTKTSLIQLARFNGFADAAAHHLAYTRLAPRIIARFGPSAGYRYLRLSDGVLRRLGIVNRDNLVLTCYK